MTRLFGGILLAVGILLMTVSGLCSLFVVIGGFQEALRDPSAIMIPAIVGGVPFLGGLGLFFAGRRLLRRANED